MKCAAPEGTAQMEPKRICGSGGVAALFRPCLGDCLFHVGTLARQETPLGLAGRGGDGIVIELQELLFATDDLVIDRFVITGQRILQGQPATMGGSSGRAALAHVHALGAKLAMDHGVKLLALGNAAVEEADESTLVSDILARMLVTVAAVDDAGVELLQGVEMVAHVCLRYAH